MMNHSHDKGQHYQDLLDLARSEARWQDIPELTRKVAKHAPHRTCLVLTAKVETQIASRSQSQPISLSRLSTPSLSQSVTPLQTAIDNERNYPEDAFQARICLSWLQFALGAFETALKNLPPSLLESYEALNREQTQRGKTKSLQICVVRAAYIKVVCLEKAGKVSEAVKTYDDTFRLVSQPPNLVASSKNYYCWANALLQRYCKVFAKYLDTMSTNLSTLLQTSAPISASSMLDPYRAWATILSTQVTHTQSPLIIAPQGTRETWHEYYKAVSWLLALRLMVVRAPHPAGFHNLDFDKSFGFDSRARQWAEVRQVEAAYEGVLFRVYDFPRANETHVEVSDFVDQVVTNWQLGCDLDTANNDHARRVTATLYAAAKKSFHSTRLLRHLSTLHTALAEFDLARKALRSYFEIVKKGQARAEKSGKPEVGLDDDTIILRTASSAIQMLCVYGRRDEAEPANEIAEYITQWLEKHNVKHFSEPNADAEDVPQEMGKQSSMLRGQVDGPIIAMAYRSRGLARCHWARLTYDTSKRPDLYTGAMNDCRHSLHPRLSDTENVASAYALAFVLAEKRESDAAITVLKQALSTISREEETEEVNGILERLDSSRSPVLSTERRLILRCWHLMSLLLSAKENYAAATGSCKAGLELYDRELNDSDQSKLGHIQLSEKTSLLELKTTQLALTEILEGPEEAINCSDELFGLYAKLFNHASVPTLKKPSALQPPSSANGTVISLRHSIVGKSKRPFASLRKSRHLHRPVSAVTSVGTASPAELTRPPTINVTDDEGMVMPENHLRPSTVMRHGSKKLQKRNSKRSVGTHRRSHDASSIQLQNLSSAPSPSAKLPLRDSRPNSSATDAAFENGVGVGVALTGDQPTSSTGPIVSPAKSNPTDQSSISKLIETLRPPEPSYPPPLFQRHSLTLLIKIWLFVSSLYHHASIPTDALAAIAEAEIHVKSIETLVANHENSSEEAFSTPGWGGLKSVAELWADILSARATIKKDQGQTDVASHLLEEALLWDEDHLDATVTLSEMLMDEYEAFFAPPAPPSPAQTPTLKALPPPHDQSQQPTPLVDPSKSSDPPSPSPTNGDPSPETLSAISARDRAYLLLLQMTESGKGWDSVEAWSAMARVWELSGEEEKAIEASWRVVELEDHRGVRSWRDSLGSGW